jgi:hypothetical protein
MLTLYLPYVVAEKRYLPKRRSQIRLREHLRIDDEARKCARKHVCYLRGCGALEFLE